MSRIVFMGTPEFAIPALEELRAAGYEIAAVITQPDRPAGRGRKLTPPPVKAWAMARRIPVFQPATLRSEEALAHIKGLDPEAIVVAAYGKLLPPPVLAVPPKGVVNIHPSLLPRHRGPTPVPAAILAGDAVTGVSIMLLDAGLDTGPVLAQRHVSIDSGDTTETLEARLAAEGGRLLTETLGPWLRGKIIPVAQDDSKATLSRLLHKEDGEIDWKMEAEDLERRVRAFTPWPGAHTRWRGTVLKIVEASVSRTTAPGLELLASPGSVVPARGGFGVVTGKGLLLPAVVQPEGRGKMMAREWTAGHRDFLGSKLPS